jgi:hypothetical protein
MQYEKKESILTMEASEINNIPMHHKVYQMILVKGWQQISL